MSQEHGGRNLLGDAADEELVVRDDHLAAAIHTKLIAHQAPKLQVPYHYANLVRFCRGDSSTEKRVRAVLIAARCAALLL